MAEAAAQVALRTVRGVYGVVGSGVDGMAEKGREALAKLGIILPHRGPYHITLFTKRELKSISAEALQTIHADLRHINHSGVGGNREEIYFAVIIWVEGQRIRKDFGLPPKNFHITLSSKDNHDMDKGIDSLLPGILPVPLAPDSLDHLIYTLHIFGRYSRVRDFSKDLILLCPDSYKGYVRMADAAFLLSFAKCAMLCYACAYERSDERKVQRYCLERILDCSKATEWGSLMLEEEGSQVDSEIAALLLAPWSDGLRSALSNSNIVPSLQLDPRQSLFIPSKMTIGPHRKLPRFVRWLIPYHLAIMSTPRSEEDIQALASPHLGIRHVLTLTEETPLPASWFHGKSISNTYLPIPNHHPPSVEQMDLVMSLFSDKTKLPLLIHCGGGKGRAGTVAACYMTAFGFSKPRFDQTQPVMAASEAISLLRQLRPKSIETSQQEAFVSTWCSTIWKRQSVYPDVPSEPPPCPLIIDGTLSKDINLFFLVGLPGSGKSTVRHSLLARDPSGWTGISQDESGSRIVCETEIGRSPGKRRVLLDRCNTAATDRKGWLSLASNWCTGSACIFFDYEPNLCITRAQMRAGHPTLPPGKRVRNAVNHMQNLLVRPTLHEGFKALVTIRSFAAAEELILRLSPPITLFKFPRTVHLFNLGAASSDDEISDVSTLPIRGTVVITEKVDGANMGFSLSSDRSKIIVQNRSHYVTSVTHEQFKKLDIWVERHREDLRVLDRDPYFAQRYILFGEWMYATHSIPYTHLPDRFIAFDLYDRSTSTWTGRDLLQKILSSTSISLVPVIHQGTMPTISQLKDMVQLPSQFWDGRVEGVCVKVERDNHVLARRKVVRGDFIASDEHWSRRNLRVNGVEASID